MSNYSVKLTKCGKCQFSLAHLPSGGGDGGGRVPVLETPGAAGRRGAAGAGGPGAGATCTGWDGGKVRGQGGPGPGDPGTGWWGCSGWDRRREGSLLPDQMARMLNY